MINPAIAFGVALLASLLWFVAIPALAAGHTLPAALHIAFLVAPIFMCMFLQYALTRRRVLTISQRMLHVSVAAVLAPVLGAALIALFWFVGLGRGV